MCSSIILIVIFGFLLYAVAVVLIATVAGVTTMADESKDKRKAKQLASLLPEDLEKLLKDVKKQRAFADISSVSTPADRLNLLQEENKIYAAIKLSLEERKKSWEIGLGSLSLEQLEGKLSELDSAKYPSSEAVWQRDILTILIENRRSALRLVK